MKSIRNFVLLSSAIFTVVVCSNENVFGSEVQNEDVSQVSTLDNVGESDSIIKTFDELTPEEQTFFLSKGFDKNDTFYSSILNSDSSDNLAARSFANALVLTASTKTITNTQGRTEYIISSLNSRMSRVSVQLNLGNVRNYTQTVNLNGALVYSGGIYFTYTGARGYKSVRLSAQVLNTFGLGTVYSSAGGLTIGR